MAGARAGDRAALEALLRRHQPRVHALCRRMLGDDRDAEDATQEALVAVVRGLPRFDGRSAFGTWVHRVTVNVCLDELRRRGRRPRTVPVDGHGPDGHARPEPADPRPGPAELVTGRLPLDAALDRLPPEHRAAVVLRDLLGLDYATIAEILAIPPGTVRSRIARGRARLADLVGPDELDGDARSTPAVGNQEGPPHVGGGRR